MRLPLISIFYLSFHLSSMARTSVEPLCALKKQSYDLISMSMVNKDKIYCRYTFKDKKIDFNKTKLSFGLTQKDNLKTKQDFTVHVLAKKMGFENYWRLKYYWCQSEFDDLKKENTNNFTGIIIQAYDKKNKLIGKKVNLYNNQIDECLDQY